MAMFMLQITPIHRANGQSTVASAAYRAGACITDERLERDFDFTRRSGVEHTEVLLPAGAPQRLSDRSVLWNAAEATERRKDARPARELLLALPHELSFEQRRELVRDFVGGSLTARGMIADVAMHTPGKEGDQRNYHVHILVTTREVGPEGFGQKGRAWDSPMAVRAFREEWEKVQNRHLERVLGPDFKAVSARSLREQGIDREPTIHLGPRATDMERRGIPSERGDVNREIRFSRERLIEARRERNAHEDRLSEAEPKQQLGVETLDAQLVKMRSDMLVEVQGWRREYEGVERPRVMSEHAVRREVLAPLQHDVKQAKARLQREKERAFGEGLRPRDVARWIKDPTRAIFAAHARLNAIEAAQRELRVAEKTHVIGDGWLRSEAGQCFVKMRIDPSRERAAEALTQRRTLERKIRRAEVRIRALDTTRAKLAKGRELGLETVVTPMRGKYGRGQVLREIDRNVTSGLQRQVDRAREHGLDRGKDIGLAFAKKIIGLPPLG